MVYIHLTGNLIQSYNMKGNGNLQNNNWAGDKVKYTNQIK